MKYIFSFLILLAIVSCNSEQPNDTHAAYWIENTSDSLSKIYVLSFKKQIKDYKGTLYILEKNKKETPFEMTEIEIDDKIVIFNVPKLNMTFKGEISENLFDLSGEFTINNQTNQYYSAEKTMDEIYYEFRDDFIKKE